MLDNAPIDDNKLRRLSKTKEREKEEATEIEETHTGQLHRD